MTAAVSVSVEFPLVIATGAVQEYYQSPRACKGLPARTGQEEQTAACRPVRPRNWARGRPLPHDLVVYDLPPDLRYRLPPPPAGHRFQRDEDYYPV